MSYIYIFFQFDGKYGSTEHVQHEPGMFGMYVCMVVCLLVILFFSAFLPYATPQETKLVIATFDCKFTQDIPRSYLATYANFTRIRLRI